MDENIQDPHTGLKGVFPGNAAQNQEGILTNNLKIHSIDGVQSTSKNREFVTEKTSTYIKLETKNPQGQVSGVLEIDLISFRERGQESRYLSINAVGASRDGNQSETTMSIDNEADFNVLKEFVSKLNWND